MSFEHRSDDGNGAGRHGRHRASLHVRFPSDIRHIEHVVALVQSQCAAHAITSPKCTLNIPVALAEALNNAVMRGNREDASKYVVVRSLVEYESITIEVMDEGPGFDFSRSMRDPTLPENILREDGRGLFLMTHLMDHVERFNDDGNVVRMTLRLDVE
jgi:serine/threonine-protein kinase RsbW